MTLPLYVPFGYITFLVGLLWLFSRHYRSRALLRKAPASWFPEPHTSRDIYVSLLSLEPPPPQSVLVSALLARAMTDVKRIVSLKEAKQALMNLLQKGQVGDELWERFLAAEKELDVEVSEVITEANEYCEGWGGSIFAVASEALQATMCQDIYKKINEQRTRLTSEFNASRPFVSNPGALRILGSKPAIPAAPIKPTVPSIPTSQAKLVMLENIRAAQAKLKLEQEKKQTTTTSMTNVSNKSKPSSPASSQDPLSDHDGEKSIVNHSKSPSSSKKKKSKKKKKN